MRITDDNMSEQVIPSLCVFTTTITKLLHITYPALTLPSAKQLHSTFSYILSIEFRADRIGWRGCSSICAAVVIVQQSGPEMNMQTTICKHQRTEFEEKTERMFWKKKIKEKDVEFK